MTERTATAALRSRYHLACIAGPDKGAVIPLTAHSILGRAGYVPLTDPTISRQHAYIHATRKNVHTATGTGITITCTHEYQPIYWKRRTPWWRRIRKQNEHLVHAGEYIRLGSDIFHVRSRPPRLQWPTIQSPASERSLRTYATRIGPFFFILFALWRLPSLFSFHSHKELWHWAFIIVTCAGLSFIIGAGLWKLYRIFRNRKQWRTIDAAFLCLVLEASVSPHMKNSRSHMLIWVGHTHHRHVYHQIIPETAEKNFTADHRDTTVYAPGFYGPYAHEMALWWCAQIAAYWGSVHVTLPQGKSIQMGTAKNPLKIFIADENTPMDLSFQGISLATAHTMHGLPAWCDTLIAAQHSPISQLWFLQCARYVHDSAKLPSSVMLSDLLTQHAPHSNHSLSTVIAHHHAPVEIDLIGDGPHALLAGTTGSGKSQALITWLLSLAHRHSPDKVRFVLIDYKGGAAFAPLQPLPHVVAVLTNFKPEETQRALHALDQHLHLRESLLHSHGFADIASWNRAFHAGTAPKPPPFIVIAIDEFREVSAEHPDIMDSVLRLASQGRSLGLHLIAATQRPSGAVHATMKANMDIRIALRCAEKSDSFDLIGSDDAAQLPRIPGRAIISSYGEVQMAYVPSASEFVASVIEIWGHKRPDPLWLPELPEKLDWDCLPENNDRGISLGLLDTGKIPPLVNDTAHSVEKHSSTVSPYTLPTLMWNQGHISCEGPGNEAHLLAETIRCLGIRIGVATQRPIHIITRPHAQSGGFCHPSLIHPIISSIVPHTSAYEVAALCEEIEDHVPAVLIIEDFPATMNTLETEYGAHAALQLQRTLFHISPYCGFTLAAAFPGLSCPHDAPFQQRFIRAFTSEEKLRSGLSQAPDISRIPGRFLVCENGNAFPCHIPQAIPQINPGHSPFVFHIPLTQEQKWKVRTLEEFSSRPAESFNAGLQHTPLANNSHNTRIPLRIGSDLAPLHIHKQARWVIIGDNTQSTHNALIRCYELQGKTLHLRTDISPHDIGHDEVCIVPATQWPRIHAAPDLHILAPEPLPETVRALRGLTGERKIRVDTCKWPKKCGLFLQGRTLERFYIDHR
ncbi:FtsK/SpoIIIE domain-containing protein [Schaalia sp. lx-100]|uniref:FtsK/SpoIIIE domain-containing protein n=1 Tax=Schaalia sp. lx-100 TaxID=2899081 RepID=UPI001E5B9D9B|nr:FtsK/SpoIIIE domain-containing protein [Schaalia sp. lx-100]MCD4558140.1 hypothetical protein [Schaalia sp. lx-100]